jgi:hypothetical protein
VPQLIVFAGPNVYDNTRADFAEVARLREGRIVSCAADVPSWAQRALSRQIEEYVNRDG